jgi:predicted thioesterase
VKAWTGRHGLENRLKGNEGKLLFEVCIMQEDKVIGEELHQRTIIEVVG